MSARRILTIGAIATAAALVLAVMMPLAGLLGWLAAMFLWSGVPLGSLGLAMTIRLTGGQWGHATLPLLEAGMMTWPLSLVALLPVFVGLGVLYPWVGEPATGFKGAWLAPFPFVARSILLFAGAGLFSWLLVARRGSALAVSSAGLIVMIAMSSLVMVDWLVSLDPRFHSSGFALYAISIQYTVAWMGASWLLLGRQPRQTGAIAAIMIALILLGLYLAFTNYFIVWSGNLASVAGWYKVRVTGAWGLLYGAAMGIEGVAFLLLLLPRARRDPRWLRAIAAATLAGKAIEAGWFALPQAGPPGLATIGAYMLSLIGIGLVFMAAQSLLLDRRVQLRSPA